MNSKNMGRCPNQRLIVRLRFERVFIRDVYIEEVGEFSKRAKIPQSPCAHFDRIDITARSNDHIHIDCYSFVNIDDGDPRAGFGDDRLRVIPRM